MERRPDLLCVDLGNKKLYMKHCVVCGVDEFELKTKEAICDDCRERIRRQDTSS